VPGQVGVTLGQAVRLLVVQELEMQGACADDEGIQSAGCERLSRTGLEGRQMGWKQGV
jgi:hypothetical protein